MRSYFNGSGSMVGTPPPSGGPGRPLPRPGGSTVMMAGGRSSSSLPRSPESDHNPAAAASSSPGLHLGAAGGGGSGHGSLGSHSSHEVSYMNIYQNTNHPLLYVSIIHFPVVVSSEMPRYEYSFPSPKMTPITTAKIRFFPHVPPPLLQFSLLFCF